MLHPETSAEPGPPGAGTLVVSLVEIKHDGNAERTQLSRVRRALNTPDLDSEFVSARSEFVSSDSEFVSAHSEFVSSDSEFVSANSGLRDAAFQFRRRSVPDYVSAHILVIRRCERARHRPGRRRHTGPQRPCRRHDDAVRATR